MLPVSRSRIKKMNGWSATKEMSRGPFEEKEASFSAMSDKRHSVKLTFAYPIVSAVSRA
jgi:hypothetical protein